MVKIYSIAIVIVRINYSILKSFTDLKKKVIV